MSYTNAFIRIAPDCPTPVGVVPNPRGGRVTVPVLQYELLTARPYALTHEELLYEVHVRHKGIDAEQARSRKRDIWAELFAKSHPCLRASALPKQYGWGVHFDEAGRIALYAAGTDEYERLVNNAGVNQLQALRNKKA